MCVSEIRSIVKPVVSERTKTEYMLGGSFTAVRLKSWVPNSFTDAVRGINDLGVLRAQMGASPLPSLRYAELECNGALLHQRLLLRLKAPREADFIFKREEQDATLVKGA